MEERLFTMPEVSDLLRTPVDTLRYWRSVGIGPKGFKVGRRVVYAASDVSAWVDAQRRAEETP